MKIKKIKLISIFLIAGIFSISLFWLLRRLPHSKILQKPNVQTETSGTFSFAVQADPHMDEQSNSTIYEQTLKNIVLAKPSFLIDLGDIFMIDKLENKNDENIKNRYVLMKSFYDLLDSTPIYFVMGNHDGETGWDFLNTKNIRQRYFPNSTFDKNYYSFVKNGSLFIVLDPYSYTTIKPNNDGWLWTLGKTQYDWLKTTLEKNEAQHKFVFIHQLVGGDSQGRGGVEMAKLYEWGGNNQNGSYGFDTNRPNWGKPIHQLLVDNNVEIVFKGHDHFYAKQELDSVIYQTVPQPSHLGNKINTAEEYGYQSGTILSGSGFLKVQVTETNVLVEFIKSDGTIADSYLK